MSITRYDKYNKQQNYEAQILRMVIGSHDKPKGSDVMVNVLRISL